MAILNLNTKEMRKLLRKRDAKIEDVLSLFGANVEKIGGAEISVEIAPNRPDLLSKQGFLRAFRAFLGRETGLKRYKVNEPGTDFKVKIDSSVRDIRPYTVCAIVKNLSFSAERITEIIDLQEKLHATLGRNRKKAAIGIYPLEKIRLPIAYSARKPEEIKFTPLGSGTDMSAREILQNHPAGIEYAHLLSGFERFPVFTDANKKILSMPPIINSHETGKITEKTKDVFIECSGSHLPALQKLLNIIVTALSDIGGKIHAMELEYEKPVGKIITPTLSTEKMRISPENVNSVLGINLNEKEMQKLLERMGYGYKGRNALVPAWRSDVMHEIDIIEDIAIAYGYANFTPEIPQVATIGEENSENKLKNNIVEILLGLGFIEISSYHLIKEDELKKFYLGIKAESKIQVENSKTDYKFLRPTLLIPTLRILAENKNSEYPHKIFEIGAVFSADKKGKKAEKETGISEVNNLLIAFSPSNFTELKRVLDYLAKILSFSYELKEAEKDGFIEGRTASILINKKEAGYFGELHPSTLRSFNIKMPLSALEISLEQLGKIHPK